MPTVLKETFTAPAPPDPPRKRWTRADCQLLESSGLWDRERLELVNGELISKMGKKRPHVQSATLLLPQLIALYGSNFVNSEAPIDVAPDDLTYNEPVPDLIVLRRNSEEFENNPKPSDLQLVIEIADSSVRYDLAIKAPLYARAGISEFWVLDVSGRRLLVHRHPENGHYRQNTVFVDGEFVRAPGTEDGEPLIAITSILPEFR